LLSVPQKPYLQRGKYLSVYQYSSDTRGCYCLINDSISEKSVKNEEWNQKTEKTVMEVSVGFGCMLLQELSNDTSEKSNKVAIGIETDYASNYQSRTVEYYCIS
jgi:hypothetical protein